MKPIYLFLETFFVFTILLYSQDFSPLQASTEFVIQVQNVPNRTITFELIPIGSKLEMKSVSSLTRK